MLKIDKSDPAILAGYYFVFSFLIYVKGIPQCITYSQFKCFIVEA